ncbi:hypothetical protein KAT36_00170 [Candidatus Pacearchaeota archaeon]|nr:hypothetical protein [Candidatus Pacearchaeota archaeon]
MKWGKIVLLFQAIVTLIIGIVFFSQLTVIGASDIADLKTEFESENSFTGDIPPTITNIKNRYTVAAYTLFVIGLIELILISRLIK